MSSKHLSLPIEISLILPAYNEAAAIQNTVGEAVRYFESRRTSYEIIVAADGDDGTREIVLEMAKANPALRAIGSPERRGKGFGIRTAVQLARGSVIGFADADNKVPIEDYGQVEPALRSGYDVVIGSRAIQGAIIMRKQPWFRQIGSKGFAVFMRTVVGLHAISDTQCGFKFFPAHVAQNLFATQQIDGYMFDVEILYLAQRFGYRIKEVPVRWRDDGDSRIGMFAGNLKSMLDIFRIRLHYRYPQEAPRDIVKTAAQTGGRA